MKNLLIKGITLSALLTSATCVADLKRFEADIEQSKWQFEGNPLSCKLSHQIPRYGQATFEKMGGKRKHLNFNLSYKRQQLKAVKVGWLRAMSPSWFPLKSSKEMGKVQLHNGPSLVTSDEQASWRMLSELETGRFPTFQYQEFTNPSDQVQVSVSAVGFKKPYDQFLDCMSGLVKYDLPELEKMTLYFDFDRSAVRSNYQKKLKALAKYVKYDPNVDVVFISGHTDSKGSRAYNEKLANKRIAAVKSLVQLDGVADSRFKTSAWGEKHPAATNRTERGRSLNRRVYLKISAK